MDEHRELDVTARVVTSAASEPRLAERVLRAVFDTSPDVIFVHAADGTVLDVNDRVYDMYGFTRAELIGRPPLELMGTGVREEDAAELIGRALAGEAVRTDSWQARKKDGSEFPVEVRLQRLELEDDLPPRVLATVRDLSEERAQADALLRNEARYRAMFEKNRTVKLLLDPEEALIIDANPAAAELYGYSLEELRGQSITMLNTMRPLEVIKAAMQRAKKERQSHFRFQHQRKDGSLVDVEISASPVELEDRTVIFSIIHDISEQKRLEQQLAEAQKMEALGRMAAGIAHDFSNLMQVVVASSELAQARLPAEHEATALLEDVRHAGTQAAALTGQLLAFGRRQVLAPRPLDLNRSLEQLYSMIVSVVGPRVRVVRSFSGPPAHVLADPAQLEQVLLNLALNARDAMSEGGTLVLGTTHRTLNEGDVPGLAPGRYVQLEVKDDGVGIPPEHLPYIFEPFFSSKEEGRGTGLGLALVYGVVRQSGGHVAVESVPGVGTTFRVLLPEAAPASAATHAGGHPPKGTGVRTALLVDDDAVVRRVLQLTLEQLGWRVLTAPDGEEAQALAATHPSEVDVLITDVRMPGLGGPRLAERVRELRPETSVLYISGGAVAHDLRLDDDPRVAFLHKPVSREDLHRTLERLLTA